MQLLRLALAALMALPDRALQLHYSGLDIKAIAAATGFCDRYHFSRVFKKLRGVSPAEFRNQQQKLFGEKS